MVSQMAQISTVDGIASLNKSVTSLSSSVTSSQALIASSLVGQKCCCPPNAGHLAQGWRHGWCVGYRFRRWDLKVSITNASGEVVHQYAVSGSQSGNVPFSWDGKDDKGNVAPEGKYMRSRLMA